MKQVKYTKINIIVETLQETNTFENILEHLKAHYDLIPTTYSSNHTFEEVSTATLTLLYLGDEEIKTFFNNHLNMNLNIGIISNESCPSATKNYAISKDIFEAIDDAFNDSLLSSIDLLQCNELIAFNRVVIGDMHGMNKVNFNQLSRFEKLKIFFSNLFRIEFKSYTLITSKDHKIQTAASGITILEHTIVGEKSAISDDLSIHDGKLNAFVLAPNSLLSYIWYLLCIFVYQRISILSLPKSLGFIQTSKLTISSDKPMDYILDSNLLSAKKIELEVLQDSITLHLGRNLFEYVKNDDNHIVEKDIIKLNTLPKGELSTILIGGKLPLFKKASEDDFKELFASLRNSAKFSYVYLILMVLSSLLATTGLFANSAPVIIGAMILAPLMAPIVSLAMGVVRAEKFLLLESAKTLTYGIGMALFFSAIFTFFIPLEHITPEMQVRLNPNLLDLMVAIFSGIAGAYASSKEEVAKSLAGVAIAVALVPPLSVTGIGIGLGELSVIYGSFLLFVTNLVGITLSAALTFIVLGFAPVTKAKKGIIYASAMMAIIAIPLFISFSDMIEKNDYYKKLEMIRYMDLDRERIELNVLNIQTHDESLLIDMEIISTLGVTHSDLQIVKTAIEDELSKKITLKVTPKILLR